MSNLVGWDGFPFLSQVKNQMPLSGGSDTLFAPEALVDIVHPANAYLLLFDSLKLLIEAVNKALEGIFNELEKTCLRLGAIQMTVVFRTGLVVVIAEQMLGRGWDLRGEQRPEFYQAGRPAIAIRKGVNPGHVDVRNNRLYQAKGAPISSWGL